MVQLAVAQLMNSVFINGQTKMAVGVYRINIGILFTNRKLLSIHSGSVPRLRSKADSYSYAEKKKRCRKKNNSFE